MPKDRMANLVRLCKEYGALEKQLQSSARDINFKRDSLFEALQEATEECREVEMARQQLLRDSLVSFLEAFAFFIQKLGKLNDSLRTESSEIDSENLPIVLVGEAAEEPFGTNFNRALETLDSLKLFCQRLVTFVNDVAESERASAKASQKTLEKHGYSKNTSSSFGVARIVNSAKYPAMASLIAGESPTCAKGWESVVKAYGSISEGHFITSEVYSNKVLPAVESSSKKITLSRKVRLVLSSHFASHGSLDAY